MKRRRVGKIAGAELHSFVLQMLLDERNLRRVIGDFADNLLNAAAFRHFENMQGLAQVKGHYLMTHVMNHALVAGRHFV